MSEVSSITISTGVITQSHSECTLIRDNTSPGTSSTSLSHFKYDWVITNHFKEELKPLQVTMQYTHNKTLTPICGYTPILVYYIKHNSHEYRQCSLGAFQGPSHQHTPTRNVFVL